MLRLGKSVRLFDIEAIELIEGPPPVIRSYKEFRPYQKWMANLLVENEGILLGADMGLGKAQPVGCLVQTPTGPRKIGDIRVGDVVFGLNGKGQKVIGVFPQGRKETYEVLFRDGTTTECSLEHLWLARAATAKERDWRVYSLKEMLSRGFSRMTKAGEWHRWEVPMCAPLQYPKKRLPVEPYALGALLGDGCFRDGAVLSTAGEDGSIRKRVSSAFSKTSFHRKKDGVVDVRVFALRPVLESLGLYGLLSVEKFIPEKYKRGSVEQRVALLHGLMDTDGTCNTRGSCCFCTTSPQLSKDFQELVQSLGGVSLLREYDRRTEGKKVEYQVTVRLDFNPFLLQRKARRWRKPVAQCRVQRKIVSIRKKGRKEHVCIAVGNADGVYLTDSCIATHNTSATLYAILQLIKRGIVCRPLIVAPKHVAENTWPEEIACWDFARSLSYAVVTGTEEERIRALEYPAQINIINRENLVWLRRYWSRRWPYDMLVYDEASRLKGGKKRTKGSKRKDKTKSPKKLSEFGVLARMRYSFMRVAELSGTPTPNGLIDLWGPVYIIDKGQRLGGSKTAYENRWFEQNRYSYSVKPLPHAEKEIMGLVSDIFFSLRSEDYLDLPPLVSVNRYVSLSPEQMRLYKKFEKERALEEWDVEAANKGVLTNKLLQCANGAIYREDQPTKELHEAKLDELESIVAESGGRPLLVAYSFKFDLLKLKKRFKFARIFGEGDNDLRDWNAGKIRMLLVHPASAGHGLNFQHGGHIAVWYGLTWSLELYRQFVKRLHRSGQKAERVFLYHILTKGTADETVMKVLENKGATQDSITNAVRVRLKKIAGRK